MVGEPLELERHRSDRLSARRDLGPGEGLDELAERERVAHSGVPRDRLDEVDRPLVRSAFERSLHAAVLVSERDLEMDHTLSVALEPEMSRLDDARVHGSDPDFVDFFPLDFEEIGDSRNQGITLRPVPSVAAGTVRLVVSDRLEPGMPLRPHAPLLRDLTLEEVSLGEVGGERRVALPHVGRGHGEGRLSRAREDRDQPHPAGRFGHSKEGDDAPSLGGPREHLAERLEPQAGDVAEPRDPAVRQAQDRSDGHQPAPNAWAARCSTESRAGGR